MELGINEYQVHAHETSAPYEEGVAKLLDKSASESFAQNELNRGLRLVYVTLGLAGEAGELANKVKKIIRDDGGEITLERARELLMEGGDVLWYLAELCSVLSVPMSEMAKANIHKLKERAEKNKLQGAGDNR